MIRAQGRQICLAVSTDNGLLSTSFKKVDFIYIIRIMSIFIYGHVVGVAAAMGPFSMHEDLILPGYGLPLVSKLGAGFNLNNNNNPRRLDDGDYNIQKMKSQH